VHQVGAYSSARHTTFKTPRQLLFARPSRNMSLSAWLLLLEEPRPRCLPACLPACNRDGPVPLSDPGKEHTL